MLSLIFLYSVNTKKCIYFLIILENFLLQITAKLTNTKELAVPPKRYLAPFNNKRLIDFSCQFTLYSKLSVALGKRIFFVSDNVPESTIQTFADVVVPLLLGTITILYIIT